MRALEGAEHDRLVFVSHSGPDTWVAKHIAREVAACGAVPFLDEAEIDPKGFDALHLAQAVRLRRYSTRGSPGATAEELISETTPTERDAWRTRQGRPSVA